MLSAPQPAHQLPSREWTALEYTYPGWHIRERPTGMWSAVRAACPSRRQAEEGLHRFIVQPGAQALAAVLAQQLDIAQRFRR
jgi:hypothetical protein